MTLHLRLVDGKLLEIVRGINSAKANNYSQNEDLRVNPMVNPENLNC